MLQMGHGRGCEEQMFACGSQGRCPREWGVVGTVGGLERKVSGECGLFGEMGQRSVV